jgi:hypothetical protein
MLFSVRARGLAFMIVQTRMVTPAFQSGGYSQRVVDASENVILRFREIRLVEGAKRPGQQLDSFKAGG